MYYTFKCETFKGKDVIITVNAKDEQTAIEKLSSYKVSKGELHSYFLVSQSETGTEKFFSNETNKSSLGFMVGMFGAALGVTQTRIYGCNNDSWYKRICTDKEIMYLIR